MGWPIHRRPVPPVTQQTPLNERDAAVTTSEPLPRDMAESASTDPIETAARILATQPPDARAALADHIPLSDGNCTACTRSGYRLAKWPCSMAAIAKRIDQIIGGADPANQS